MKKLLRILAGVILIFAGASTIFFSGSAFLGGLGWIETVMYVSLIVISLGLMALGWAIISAKKVRSMLQDLFSGISF